MGRAASWPVYVLQGILVCKAAGPGSLSLLELSSVSRARGRKSGKKSEIREGLSREAAAASPKPRSSGELRQEGSIQEGSRGGGRQLGGLHLLLKEPRSQAERRKDLAFTSTGLLSSFERAFRKEKARLKGSTKESQRHA